MSGEDVAILKGSDQKLNDDVAAHSRVGRGIAVLCLYYFFHEFQPSRAFLVPFWMAALDITPEYIYKYIFPVATYSTLPLVILSGFLYSVAGYRLTLLLSSICGIAQSLLAVFAVNTAMLVLSELTWSFSFASLFCVLATKFVLLPNRNDFQKASSLNRLSVLLSLVISSVLGQILVQFHVAMSINFYISAVCSFLSIPVLQLMPPINPVAASVVPWREIWRASTSAGSILAIWAGCSATVTAIHFLVNSYWPTLFADLDSSRDYNGYSLAVAQSLGALCASIPLMGRFHPKFSANLRRMAPWLAAAALVVAAVLLSSIIQVKSLFWGIVVFCLYFAPAEFLIAVSNAMVGWSFSLHSSQFGWILTLVTLVGMALQVILQLIIEELTIKEGFLLLGLSLAAGFLAFLCAMIVRQSRCCAIHHSENLND